MTIAYLGLGANLGETLNTLQDAIMALAQQEGINVCACSSLYRSAPVQADGADYINGVIEIETQLPPRSILAILMEIEARFGRTRPYPNAPRTLDIDLLLYGEICLDEADLIIPHPRLIERAFVLIPLLELAPDIEILQRGRAIDFLASVASQKISKLAAIPQTVSNQIGCI